MKWLGLGFLLILLLGANGCAALAFSLASFGTAGANSGNVQANTRAFEENYLGEGEAPFMFRYADDLFYQGRYREAVTAYYNCEMGAYSNSLREAARARRMYLQELIVAYENGATPQPPPVVDHTKSVGVTAKPNYDNKDFYGHGDMNVVAAHPRQLKPNNHYVQDEADYHIYGYPSYPGDIPPQQIKVPEKPPTPTE